MPESAGPVRWTSPSVKGSRVWSGHTAIGACGDGESSSDAFIGTWTYNAGSINNTEWPDNQLDSNDPPIRR